MTTSPAPLALVPTDPDHQRDRLGRSRPRRRTRIGHTRPGLPADPAHPWHRAVTTWAESLTALSESTRDIYMRHVSWLAGDHADHSPWTLDAAHLASWLNRQHWSTSTRRAVIVSVRNFYRWAVRADLCAASPLTGVTVTPPAPPGPRRTELPERWRQPVTDWLTWLRAAARTEATLTSRRQQLSGLAQLHADPWAVTEGDLGRWLSAADITPATKRTRRAAARSFYSWAERTGRTATDPATDLDPIRQRRALPRPTPSDVLHDALDVADPRVTLALHLAIYAGLRRAEIASLHTRDVHEHALHVVGKGGDERMVPLHPELAAILRSELHDRQTSAETGNSRPGWPTTPAVDGWVFPSTDRDQHVSPRWLGRLVSRTLAPGWTAHTIRHRFATQAYAAQRDLRAVQELLGHSKPETTARYAAIPEAALTGAVGGVTL